ncbi:MAG: response regulator, partial [Candidatus Electrothrix sp. AR4]|nr:response regulator [Candidatus Electrothrix sp. AR4]
KVNIISSDKGTCFQLYFPSDKAEKEERRASVYTENLAGANEHILVIDDDDQLRDIACQMLTHLGYKVDAVSSGEHGLDFVKKNPVDLMVLDMLMEPGMNGRQTYEEVIKLYPGQKAIIVSGFSESDEVREALRLGATEFIHKPYSLESLGHALKKALHG